MIPMIPLIVWMDLIGTIAFAISGALVAARKNMDLFGVNILAVITATGGGMIRDLVIGVIPPVMFRNPVYVFVSMITADVVFLFLYSEQEIPMSAKKREHLLFWFDTLGLAAFTVDGVFAGTGAGYADRLFLISFLGVVTGVGGGALRDIFANQMPQIFVKHVYAVASVAGALVTGLLYRLVGGTHVPAFFGAAAVIALRYAAMSRKWNLPRLNKAHGTGEHGM